MQELGGLSCANFTRELASGAAVPGGGGASALVGAIGVALGSMVANLTIGKAAYASVEAELIAIREQVTTLREELISLVDEDAHVFAPLAQAYRMPKSNPEECARKEAIMEACLKAATEVPLRTMEKCGEAIELLDKCKDLGAKIAISDVGVGVALCGAALKSASLNVFINTAAMTDREYAKFANDKAEQLTASYVPKADAIFAAVAGTILGG